MSLYSYFVAVPYDRKTFECARRVRRIQKHFRATLSLSRRSSDVNIKVQSDVVQRRTDLECRWNHFTVCIECDEQG